jgi:dihydropteroate synthase
MNKLSVEDTHFHSNNLIRIKDKLLDLAIPQVMGIVNCTPDSFYTGSRKQTETEILKQVEKHLSEGANIIDLGGYSSRPGAKEVSCEEELNRVIPVIAKIKKEFNTIISLDTFRAEVARQGLENGIDIINDISAFEIDNELINVLGKYKCPYILMHMNGTPTTMQNNTNYNNLFNDIILFLSNKIQKLKKIGVNEIIIDPGFGFGKNLEQNYEMLYNLETLKILNKPILVGISRKSMIYNKLNTSPENSLNGTTVINSLAITKGASILRVHDVKEAYETIQLLKH